MIEALTRRTIMEAESPKARVVQPGEGLQYNVMGAMMTYKATAHDTRGAYSLAIEVTPPHGGLPLHVHHQEDEAMYILEGEYEIQCGDQAFRATARQVPLHHVSWRIRKARGENELTHERRPAGYAESHGNCPPARN
jgi:mannose-6-phosphate isomerase-like protein (cupin superfamily)